MQLSARHRADLVKACQNQMPLFLSVDGLDISFQTEILKVQETQLIIENCVPPSYIRRVTQGKRFFIQLNMLRYKTDHIDTDGKNMIFPFSDLSVIEETRTLERVSFTSEEKVVCNLSNPFDEETVLQKAIVDLSANGVAIKSALHSKLFLPNTKFSRIDIVVDGSLFSRTAGEVIYVRTIMDVRGVQYRQVGIKFTENIVSPSLIHTEQS